MRGRAVGVQVVVWRAELSWFELTMGLDVVHCDDTCTCSPTCTWPSGSGLSFQYWLLFRDWLSDFHTLQNLGDLAG